MKAPEIMLPFARVDKILFTPEGTVVALSAASQNIQERLASSINPVLGNVILNVEIGQQATVEGASLFIYDNDGNVVRGLRAGDDGSYAWNGTDLQGNTVMPGVYFYGNEQKRVMGKVLYIK